MTDAHWVKLKAVMGNPSWADAANLDQAQGRYDAKNLDTKISLWTEDKDASELMVQCQAAGVPTGVVQTGIDLAENDPQLAQANFFRKIDDVHPVLGQIWTDSLPLHFEKTPCHHYEQVKQVGEDNASVLKDWLGIGEDATRTVVENSGFT